MDKPTQHCDEDSPNRKYNLNPFSKIKYLLASWVQNNIWSTVPLFEREDRDDF